MSNNTKQQVPKMFIELVDIGNSGWVREDTLGTDTEEVLNCAGLVPIPPTGMMAEEILDEKGQPTGDFKNVEIRYIKNCKFIKVEDQKKYGYEPHRAGVDIIHIKNGKELIERKGDVGKFDYLANVYYNASAPNRSNGAKALFKVVDNVKVVDKVNEDKFLQAEAISYVKTLLIKNGKEYQYKESKIDSILNMLGKHGGENYSEKINTLTSEAEKQPAKFLEAVTQLEQVTITEVSHALELNVIMFEGSSVVYVADKKVLCLLDGNVKSQDKKINALADLLKTPEYAQAYQELKAKNEVAETELLEGKK